MGNTLMTKFLQELVSCCFEQTNQSSFANIERFLVGFQVDYNFIRILDQKMKLITTNTLYSNLF